LPIDKTVVSIYSMVLESISLADGATLLLAAVGSMYLVLEAEAGVPPQPVAAELALTRRLVGYKLRWVV